jgi:hypothetical protein
MVWSLEIALRVHASGLAATGASAAVSYTDRHSQRQVRIWYRDLAHDQGIMRVGPPNWAKVRLMVVSRLP